MKVIVRKAQNSELKEIQDLSYQLFLHDQQYDPLLDMDWPYGQEGSDYFKSRISGEKGVCFVAEFNGRIVGYLAGGIVKDPPHYRKVKKQAELENTLVLDSFRGKGIGTKLFNKFLNWSREHGAEKIKVNTATGNLNAVSFYKEVGFTDYATELEHETS